MNLNLQVQSLIDFYFTPYIIFAVLPNNTDTYICGVQGFSASSTIYNVSTQAVLKKTCNLCSMYILNNS